MKVKQGDMGIERGGHSHVSGPGAALRELGKGATEPGGRQVQWVETEL